MHYTRNIYTLVPVAHRKQGSAAAQRRSRLSNSIVSSSHLLLVGGNHWHPLLACSEWQWEQDIQLTGRGVAQHWIPEWLVLEAAGHSSALTEEATGCWWGPGPCPSSLWYCHLTEQQKSVSEGPATAPPCSRYNFNMFSNPEWASWMDVASAWSPAS